MSKKWTYNAIRDFVEKNSEVTLLSTEYTGFSQRLQFKCTCGETFEKTFKKFKENHQRKCTTCEPIKPSRQGKSASN